ncbi:MAG: hypothetical protein WCA46_26630 [Actinocatenispora sp.]
MSDPTVTDAEPGPPEESGGPAGPADNAVPATGPGADADWAAPDPSATAPSVAGAADDGPGADAAEGDGSAVAVEESAEPADDGDLAALDSAMASDDGSEPRRHWLRYPGLVGALAVVAMVILVPCGGGLLFFNGAFADHGRYPTAPDACARLGSSQVRDAFGDGLLRADSTGNSDGSTCTYQGSAATGPSRVVRLSLTRYDTKGPLSAPRVAHVGLTNDFSDQVSQGGRSRGTVRHLGDEAVALRHETGVTVYARFSNLVLRLDTAGDEPDLEPHAVSAARRVGSTLS